MFRMKTKESKVSSPAKGRGATGETAGLEARPGGMLVQKRLSDANQNHAVVPTIKVRVKYGSIYHEISISSQASFGDLKKLLAGSTGLHPQDQKLLYKDKEKDSKVFLDHAGVKNGSKILLIEDELSIERRYIESRKTAKMEKAAKDIAAIRFEIDLLIKQVVAVEMEICNGKKVMEIVISNLTEMLMTQLIKLDGIVAEGDVKSQRRMQVKRVQKYIEHLDMLKIKNPTIAKSQPKEVEVQFNGQRQMPNSVERILGPVVMTTHWETF